MSASREVSSSVNLDDDLGDRSLVACVHVLVEDSTKVKVDVDVDRQVYAGGDVQSQLGEIVSSTVKAALTKRGGT